jgi:hypothetical protein
MQLPGVLSWCQLPNNICPEKGKMEDYQLRVLEEKKELFSKMEKLTVFIGGTAFKSLEDHDQFLLIQQLALMDCYHRVLRERVERFNEPRKPKPE